MEDTGTTTGMSDSSGQPSSNESTDTGMDSATTEPATSDDSGSSDSTGPGMDVCDGVVDLGDELPVQVTGDTVAESNDYAAGCFPQCAADAAFSWTAPSPGLYTIDTMGSMFDTGLYILDGCGKGPEIACNDDSVGELSALYIQLAEGQTITIVVDGYGLEEGPFQLNITEGKAFECLGGSGCDPDEYCDNGICVPDEEPVGGSSDGGWSGTWGGSGGGWGGTSGGGWGGSGSGGGWGGSGTGGWSGGPATTGASATSGGWGGSGTGGWVGSDSDGGWVGSGSDGGWVGSDTGWWGSDSGGWWGSDTGWWGSDSGGWVGTDTGTGGWVGTGGLGTGSGSWGDSGDWSDSDGGAVGSDSGDSGGDSGGEVCDLPPGWDTKHK